MTTISSLLCLVLLVLLALVKIFHKLWWTPTRIQKFMALQGIKGPPYRLVHGNTKEILRMQKQNLGSPKKLSHDILCAVQPHVHTWSNIYGKIYLQWHNSQAQLVIMEPELCKEILNNKDRAYPKKEFGNFEKKIVGDGMATALNVAKWMKLRKIANHAFHGESLKSMIPTMVACTEIMLERWKNHEGKEIEVFEELRLFTSEVIAKTAFGSNHGEGQNIFEMLMKLFFIALKNIFTIRPPGMMSKLYKTSDEAEAERIEKRMHKSLFEIIKRREEKATTGNNDGFGSDYLGLLLKAHHDANEKERISVDDMIDECKTFYFAGQETTNIELAWIVFLLAVHTDWQEEARKEVLELFGKQNPSPEGIAKLKTMSMIINESLRLYPPAVSIERKVDREVRLGNFIIPANVELVIPILAIHHEPEFWGQDAQLFKPERFARGVAKATNSNIATYIPFGMGPRTCVGMDFAIIEVKIALSMILQRYSFTLSPAYVHSHVRFILRPQHGVQIILHPLVNCP
ncbi:cytochrome P450 CYP749A22-like [Pyrus communis]|uniref:cytochrome P450 CYP749A22-like n=1 Tax=Pyrus communis TaxID=23211 RepID=UPI0035BEC1D7